jgi:hypothetical protein
MGLASALVLFGMRYLVDKKWSYFIVTVLAASMFQVSAVFVFFGAFLYRLNLKTRTLLVLLIVALIMGAFMPVAYKVFDVFLKFHVGGSLFDRGMSYYGNVEYGYMLGVFRPSMMKHLIMCLLAMKFRNYLKKRIACFDVLFVFYCAGAMWMFLFNDMAVIAARGGAVLTVGGPVIFASFLLLFNDMRRTLMAPLFYMVCALFLWLNFSAFDYPAYSSVLF